MFNWPTFQNYSSWRDRKGTAPIRFFLHFYSKIFSDVLPVNMQTTSQKQTCIRTLFNFSYSYYYIICKASLVIYISATHYTLCVVGCDIKPWGPKSTEPKEAIIIHQLKIPPSTFLVLAPGFKGWWAKLLRGSGGRSRMWQSQVKSTSVEFRFCISNQLESDKDLSHYHN